MDYALPETPTLHTLILYLPLPTHTIKKYILKDDLLIAPVDTRDGYHGGMGGRWVVSVVEEIWNVIKEWLYESSVGLGNIGMLRTQEDVP